MKVLVACEFSGIVRDAFTKRGHDAWSCDLLPTETKGNHWQGDVFNILYDPRFDWDLLIHHAPLKRYVAKIQFPINMHWHSLAENMTR